MRLTYKTDNGEYTGMSNNIEIKTALQKLAILEDIEEKLGIDLITLFKISSLQLKALAELTKEELENEKK